MLFIVKAAASPLAASVVLVVVAAFPLASAKAAEPTSFTIPTEDGYGIADCLQAGSACGRAMANSFCEAHGHVRAVAYGSADDVTGSVPHDASTESPPPTGIIISCTD